MLPIQSPRIFKSVHHMRFSEMDPYGHMNTTHYLTYFLEHRFECMRKQLGWDLKTISEMPQAFLTVSAKVDYLRPVRPDQEFEITSYLNAAGTTKVQLLGEMKLADGKIAAKLELIVVCFDKASQRVIHWPPGLVELFVEKDSSVGVAENCG
jgi:acyl-CoA thioester hydrolase